MTTKIDPALAIEQRALRHLDPITDLINRGDSPMQQFYDGATVFVTGGSGFLGKQLIEKLFRACNIKKLYVLLRPKKGKPAKERLQEMLKDPVFDLVHKHRPDFPDKINAVAGDVSDIKLGLNDNDWNILIQEVTVIFHVAATTKFDESLSIATLINVRGTREALTLGEACQKLRSFVHVSTAYSNATDKTLDKKVLESFYPAAVLPETLIGLVEYVEEQKLRDLEATFIKGYPNSYTFAKSVAEAEVRKWAGKFPVCIVRPAIVISSYKEPSPGWTDMSCVYGASGLVSAPASGLMHVAYRREDCMFNLVPVDYVNNAIIAAGYTTGTARKYEEPKIYTLSSSNNRLSWKFVSAKLKHLCNEIPPPIAIWYIFLLETSNLTLFSILSWLVHFIPGYILDGVSVILRKKPRFRALTRKIFNISKALAYFTTHSWHFDETNTSKLYQSLSESDKVIFNFDTTDINHEEFMTLWLIGLRKYVFKDGLSNTDKAIKKQYWFRLLHIVVSVLYFYILWQVAKFVFNVIGNVYANYLLVQ